MFDWKKSRDGFTLIELLIVVVILGLLAALAIPRYTYTSGKAKKSEAKTILKQLFQLEISYFQEHDLYVAGANKAALVASNLGFEDPGADTRYDYSVTVAGKTFVATAIEIGDVDQDGTPNESLTMDQDGLEGGDW
ncbi:MAG: prepilin-type N-terminal cleavage/methylation domain-containing protein [Gemmatimonadota bacterium]|nr:MAG: prepilin-type N-terminal cleavage/methylation domain-containing protein [Gemmatimonadota bacterium]